MTSLDVKSVCVRVCLVEMVDRPVVAVTAASSVPREGEPESYHSEKLLKRKREREKKKTCRGFRKQSLMGK